jgi:hypothetical protein
MEDGVGGGGEFMYSERGTTQGINTHFHFKEVSVTGVNSDVALVILLHSSSFPVSRISKVTSGLLGRSLCSSSHSSRVRPKKHLIPAISHETPQSLSEGCAVRSLELSDCNDGARVDKIVHRPPNALEHVVHSSLHSERLEHCFNLCVSVTFTLRRSFHWIRDRNWKS